MNKKLDISVIIVNYNVKSYLEQALLSIEKSLSGLNSEIFVVDNASSDGSVPMVRKKFPHVRLIANTDNVGFARANNQAIRESRGRYICLINPDTFVQEDTFRVCVDYLDSHDAVGMVGGKVLNSDGSLQLACRRSFPTPWVAFTKVMGFSTLFPRSKLFGRYNLTYLDPDAESEVEAISGSFMVVRNTVIEQVGALDEQFFMYGEDLDWCYRIGQAGWKIMYVPATQIVHYKGRSTREASIDALKLFYGAMVLFVRKHFGRGLYFLPQWILTAGIWCRGAIGFLINLARMLIVPCVDLIFMQIALILALLLRFGHLLHWSSYLIVNGSYTMVWLVTLALMGLYKRGVFSLAKSFGAVLIGLMINASLTFFFPQYQFSRQVVLVAGLLNILFLSGWRLGIRIASRLRWVPFIGTVGKTWLMRRAVILGTDAAAKDVFKRLKNRLVSGYEVIGLLAQDESELANGVNSETPVLGLVQDLPRLTRRHQIHEVIFTPEAASYERILSVITMSKDLHLDFKMVPSEIDVLIGRTSIDAIEDIPLVELDYKIFRSSNQWLKRTGDLILAGIFLLLSLPVWIGLLIDQKFRFRQIPLSNGRDGRILIYNLEKNGIPVPERQQIIPRMWAVLQGGMSLVGTEIVPFAEGQQGAGFKPGLTGLVQVQSSESLTIGEKEQYTRYYLKNYSILLDLEILLRSLFH